MNPNELRKQMKADASMLSEWVMKTVKDFEDEAMREIFELGASLQMSELDVMKLIQKHGYHEIREILQELVDYAKARNNE